jgi:ubiquitin-protein ligase
MDKRLDHSPLGRMDQFSLQVQQCLVYAAEDGSCSNTDKDDDDDVSHPWHYEQWHYSDGLVFERQSSPRPRRRCPKRPSIYLYPLYRPGNSTLSAYRILLVFVTLCCLVIPTTEATQAENPTITNPAASSSITATSTLISPQDLSAAKPRPPPNKTKRKRPKKKTVAGQTGTILQAGSQATFLRRVQSEWKDAVEMGIAYDWVKQKPIQSKTRSSKKFKGFAVVKADDDESESPQHPTANATSSGIQSNQTQAQQMQHHRKYMCLGPLGKNLFVWLFSFAGMEGSNFEGGIYSGLLILPKNYPMSPPRVQVWTPSGRFVQRADICISASSFHPETWNPAAYSFRTIIESLRLHMLTHAVEIGGMNSKPADQRDLARKSRTWKLRSLKSIAIDHARLIQQGFAAADGNPGEADLEDQSGTRTDSGVQQLLFHHHVEDESILMQNQEEDCHRVQTKRREMKKKRTSKKMTKAMELRDEETGLVTNVVRSLFDNRKLLLGFILAFVYYFVFGGF